MRHYLGATTQSINYSYDEIDQLTSEHSTEQNPLLDKEYSYDAGALWAGAIAKRVRMRARPSLTPPIPQSSHAIDDRVQEQKRLNSVILEG